MKRFLKSCLSLLLAITIIVSSAHVGLSEVDFGMGFGIESQAATFDEINADNVFIKQGAGTVTCTLCASVNMMRRVSMMRGDANWATITESSAKPSAWISGTGLSGAFSYSDSANGIEKISVTCSTLPGNSSNTSILINLLASHPEGIVIYNGVHAVLLTDYTNGVFYCNDPDDEQPVGRVTANKAYSVRPENATKYWYVTYPSVSLNNYTEPPEILSLTVENVSSEGYTAVCTLNDASSVTLADFIVWTENNGQDDISNIHGTKNGNTFSVFVPSNQHNYEQGKYITHLYIYYNGTSSSVAFPAITLSDTEGPQFSDIIISNISKDGYIAKCSFIDQSDVVKADFMVWTAYNGQDDMNCNNGTIQGNTAYIEIKTSDHNNEHGEYNTHVYVYDAIGNVSSIAFPIVNLSETITPSISSLQVTNITSDGYRASCKVEDISGIAQVDFMVWTAYNGQDDMNCNTGTIEGNIAYVDIRTSDHNNERGEYNTHVYVYDNLGNISSIAFPIVNLSETTPPSVYDFQITNITSDGYRVSCKVEDISGVAKADFMVWTSYNGQDDMNCNTGIIEGNIAYVDIKTSDHNNERGEYNTHIYVYDNLGNVTGCAFDKINLSGYTVIYDSNGGTGAPSLQTKTHGQTLTLSSTVPTRTGHIFQGWSTSNTAINATYSVGDSFTVDADTTLYAVWKKVVKETEKSLIDYSNAKIYTTVENCNDVTEILDLSDNAEVALFASQNNDIYGTGTVIIVYEGDTQVGVFDLIVNGDTNYDSVCDALDAAQVALVMNGHDTMGSLSKLAADSNSDDEISIEDYQAIVNQVVA